MKKKRHIKVKKPKYRRSDPPMVQHVYVGEAGLRLWEDLLDSMATQHIKTSLNSSEQLKTPE